MRVLKFIVDGNSIKQDPDCDFTGLFPGKEDQVRAEFTFSKEWQKRVKVAAFRQARTNYSNITVLNDSGVKMELRYNADTQLYIDNKIAEAIAALTNNT